MLTDRLSAYKTVIVDTNKEVDYLDSKLASYTFDDFEYWRVPQYCVGRMDLVSHIHYGTVDLWWLIAKANNIVDPLSELESGMELKIPNVMAYYDFYSKNVDIDTTEDLPNSVGQLNV